MVRAIEHDCNVVPRGSVQLTPNHFVKRDNTFTGLANKESLSPEMWMHFRPVDTQEKRDVLDRDEGCLRQDFLDALDSDVPRGQWALVSSWNDKTVSVRNLLWPGYCAWHICNTNRTASCYIGDGVKNVDFPFLI